MTEPLCFNTNLAQVRGQFLQIPIVLILRTFIWYEDLSKLKVAIPIVHNYKRSSFKSNFEGFTYWQFLLFLFQVDPANIEGLTSRLEQKDKEICALKQAAKVNNKTKYVFVREFQYNNLKLFQYTLHVWEK